MYIPVCTTIKVFQRERERERERYLHTEQKKQCVQFKPAVLVDNIRAQHPSKSRQGVAGIAKRLCVEEEAEDMSNCADYPPRSHG